MTARRAAVLFVGVLIATLAVDQATKAWARGLPVSPAGCAQPADLLALRCAGVPQPVVHGFWDWELAYNPGAAFSSFATLSHTATQVVLSLLAIGALIAVFWIGLRRRPDDGWRRAAYALIGGGALGNLIDRLHDGAVTDFVRWRIHDHRWPIFNVADAALLVGVGLLVISGLSWFERASGGTRTPTRLSTGT
jgi:signal peptidase II